jgi:hypothetical protein
VTTQEWLAPGLDCLPLRVSAVMKNTDGSVFGRYTEEVSDIRLGEPDKSLFEVPAGLAEHSPSEVMAAEMPQRGEPCVGCKSSAVAAADANYSKRRK